jgi:hypothetical protein
MEFAPVLKGIPPAAQAVEGWNVMKISYASGG